MFRYAVIYERGGIYTDTDVFCRSPIGAWTTPFVSGESIESVGCRSPSPSASVMFILPVSHQKKGAFLLPTIVILFLGRLCAPPTHCMVHSAT